MNTKQYLRIGELAAALNLNPKTIRFYEDIGLLPQPRRSSAGYRLYDEADQERLRFILKAKAVGLSLEEISEIFSICAEGQPPCEHVIAILDRKLAAVDEQLRMLTEFRQELAALRQAAANAVPADGAGVCQIIKHHALLHAYDFDAGPQLHRRSSQRKA